MKDKWVVAGIAAAVLAAFAFIVWPSGRDAHGHLEGGATSLDALFPAPAFAFPDQHGHTVTLQSLQGKVWVANFIFTTCRTICPLLTAKMGQLQRRLEGVDARFVSFSVDPDHDTPEALLAYARHWRPDEARWSLLATTAATLPSLTQGFRVSAEKVDGGALGDPILHSSIFLLVDGEGLVRGVYDSERPEQFALLEGQLRSLTHSQGVAPPLAQSGEALYHQLGCVGCHERPELAPTLHGLAGMRRNFADGMVAVADEAYVRESILVPQAKRVVGYPLMMPTFAGLIDDAALGRLVTFILALPPAAAPVDDGVAVETDPVCGMQVRATADAPHTEHQGKTVWFCSEQCQAQFAAHPEAYGGAR